MNVLITGVSGFAGSHLAEYLSENAKAIFRLYGTSLNATAPSAPFDRLPRRLNLLSCDVSHPNEIQRVLIETKPDIIFHLAGISYVPHAEKDRTLAYAVNAIAVHHLLEAVRESCPAARTILVSSSEIYGKVAPDALPLSESQPFNPHNAYGASKAAMEMIARNVIHRNELDVIVMRPFNHIGPRQSENFSVSNFCRQISQIMAGTQPRVLRVGDLEPRRDFVDVRDVVRGYWLAATKGRRGETYQICSGRSFSIRQVIEGLIKLSDLDIDIVQDRARMRNNDLPILEGSFDRLHRDTGWTPVISLETTLRDTLAYWNDMLPGS